MTSKAQTANAIQLMSQLKNRQVRCKHELMRKLRWNEDKLDRVKSEARAMLSSMEPTLREKHGYGLRLVWHKVDKNHCGKRGCFTVFSLAEVYEDIEEPVEHLRRTINGLFDHSNDLKAAFIVVDQSEFEELVESEKQAAKEAAKIPEIRAELARLQDLLG